MSIAIIALLVSCSASAPLEVITPTLTDLCDTSARIVIGRVERIVQVPTPVSKQSEEESYEWNLEDKKTVPVAELSIERVIKGPNDKQIQFLAMGTWTCDSSTAEVGERVLIFLSPWQRFDEAKTKATAPVVVANNSARVWQIAWAGRGRMKFVHDPNGAEMLQPFDVCTPRWMRHDGEGVPVQPLLDYVTTVARFEPKALSLCVGAYRGQSQPADPKDESFELRVLADGSFRLTTGVLEDEHVKLGKFEPDALRDLFSSLKQSGADLCKGLVGEVSRWQRWRWLQAPSVGLEHNASLGVLGTDAAPTPRDLERAQHFLKLWKIARSLIDCSECMTEQDPAPSKR